MKILKVRLVNSNMSVAIDYEDSEGVEHLLIVGAEKVVENWQAVEHTLAPDGALCKCENIESAIIRLVCKDCGLPLRPAGKA